MREVEVARRLSGGAGLKECRREVVGDGGREAWQVLCTSISITWPDGPFYIRVLLTCFSIGIVRTKSTLKLNTARS